MTENAASPIRGPDLDLNGIVSQVIISVNNPTMATYQPSTGSATAYSGTRTPTYGTPTPVSIQVQGFAEKELAHLNSLNIGGVLRKVYMEGELASLIRADARGGDLLTFNAHDWLAVHVMEQWTDWCCVAVQQQAPQ